MEGELLSICKGIAPDKSRYVVLWKHGGKLWWVYAPKGLSDELAACGWFKNLGENPGQKMLNTGYGLPNTPSAYTVKAYFPEVVLDAQA